eukprot:CAMPEP_0182568352 /NCGR_PEP_ID=MMETSP1324-20130603/9324_1 /TAXON_ID=236786 /ORGANISM="Florenciella sp., Strain RCC1587" /LENGTH=187 /DNA_ID=CAMNT_0024782485 /DNA_START=50 /DNA_END=613 /DNA_ORIENTATION=-
MPKETKKKGAKTAEAKTPRFYPADDLPPAKVKMVNNPCKLRASITPGTILILLSGRFRGKRVVFLKQLDSGLLLVTGPYAVNGVPIKRVNQAYVIATSQKVDLTGVKVPAIDDAYFAREAEEKAEDDEGVFSAAKAGGSGPSEQRKTDQAALDKAMMGSIKKTEMLEAYLQAKFSLKNGDKPHEMVF